MDSSAWILNFLETNKKIEGLLSNEENDVLTSVLSFYEIARFFGKKRADKELPKALDIVRRRSAIVELTEKTCLEAAKEAAQHGLYAIDAIILTSAKEHNATLVTADKDFKGKNIRDVLFV